MNFEAIGTMWAPRLLSILRIASGLFLLEHGTAKLFKFPVAPQFAKLDLASMGGIAAYFELVGGALLLVGLFTRPVAFIMSGMCAIAYFYGHAGRAFYPIINGGELAALYSFVLLYIAAAGAGPWSIDASRNK